MVNLKFLDMKLDSRKTKNLEKNENKKKIILLKKNKTQYLFQIIQKIKI